MHLHAFLMHTDDYFLEADRLFHKYSSYNSMNFRITYKNHIYI